jgi:long-subunit acyl-CoA synthetase (AMP-forming)
MTYEAWGKQVEAYKVALMADLGVVKGDVVATISRNRPEWATAAYATYGCGAAFVPMYENQHASEWKYVLNDSGAKVVLCATDAIRKQVAELCSRGELPALKHVLTFGDEAFAAMMRGNQRVDANVHANDVASTIEKLRANLGMLKPQVLFCVPSLFEKLHLGIKVMRDPSL